MLVSIIVVFIMLGFLATAHELGHFFVACLLKIRAYEVSIFVGPTLFSWKRKGVDYTIRSIPIGAYVRFSDFDDNGDVVVSDDPTLLINQPRWKRFLVSIAGPLVNAILGVIIFVILYSCTYYSTLELTEASSGTQLYDTSYVVGDTICKVNGHRVWNVLDLYFETEMGTTDNDEMVLTLKSKETNEYYDITLIPTIKTRVMLGIQYYDSTDNKYNGWEMINVMPEQNNGNPVLKAGDYIIEIDGIKVTDDYIHEYLDDVISDDSTLKIKYVRNGVEYEDCIVKTLMTYANLRGIRTTNKYVNSFGSFMEAFKSAALMPVTIANVSIRSVGIVFEGKEEVYNMVSGPVGVTTAVSDVVQDVDQTTKIKLVNIVNMAAMISVALAFTNFLPIPGLDGMQIVLLITEMILGRAISKKSENILNIIGFVLIVALVIFALTSDVIRIFVGGM